MDIAIRIAGAACVAACAIPACAQGAKPERDAIAAHVNRPATVEPTDARIAGLRVPAGFTVSVFAKDLGHPRMLAVDDEGTVFVTRRGSDDVLALADGDGDGRADETRTAASNLKGVHGITIHDGHVYLATVKEVYRARHNPGGRLGVPERLIDDLPDAGQHPNRTLAFGPDGLLFITVGSTCNACKESSEESATVLRAQPDGTRREVFASGLRNTIGFGWHPGTGELWGMDHGIDYLGDDIPPEELNRLTEGADYGWPYAYGDRQIYQAIEPPPGVSKEEHASKSVPPVLEYQAHSSPLALVFYTADQFPQPYRDGAAAFVSFRGSWNRKEPTGYKVARVIFENGQPVRFEDFLTGFLSEDGTECFGRPVGLAVANDGALLVSDDTGGVIYRVSYTGDDQADAQADPNDTIRSE